MFYFERLGFGAGGFFGDGFRGGGGLGGGGREGRGGWLPVIESSLGLRIVSLNGFVGRFRRFFMDAFMH